MTHSDRDASEPRTLGGCMWCNEDACDHGARLATHEVPAGPPLHEQADRDGDNVPSDRDAAERPYLCRHGHYADEHWCDDHADRDADNVPSDEDRVREYAEVIREAAWPASMGLGEAALEHIAGRCVEVGERRTAALLAEYERLRMEVRAVVARMTNRKVDHRHEDQVGHWGVKGRAYFYAGDIYDDWTDLRAALRGPQPTEEPS